MEKLSLKDAFKNLPTPAEHSDQQIEIETLMDFAENALEDDEMEAIREQLAYCNDSSEMALAFMEAPGLLERADEAETHSFQETPPAPAVSPTPKSDRLEPGKATALAFWSPWLIAAASLLFAVVVGLKPGQLSGDAVQPAAFQTRQIQVVGLMAEEVVYRNTPPFAQESQYEKIARPQVDLDLLLQLNFERLPASQALFWELRSERGQVVMRPQKLKLSEDRSFTIILPARQLTPGRFQVHLVDNAVEPSAKVGTWLFEITP